jgi:hypothetical protein
MAALDGSVDGTVIHRLPLPPPTARATPVRMSTDHPVSVLRDPRPNGEERQVQAGGVHRSPARSWAGSVSLG